MKINSSAVMLIWIAVAFGCSGIGTNPVQPIDKPANTAKSTSVDTQRQLWGVWDIGMDLETLSATVMPDRNVESHFNVLPFLSPPNCSDCLKLHVNSFDEVTRILDVDVTLRNKFAIAGYDVRGILFTDEFGHLLKNENAWTELYDIPGGDTINPFIAFAKDDPQRKFPGLAQLTENYKIWVPDPPKFITIKYAVDASFPANCHEPYSIQNLTQAEITNEIGSHGIISIDVNDWQWDVDSVTLDALDLNDESLALTHMSGDTWSGDFSNLKAMTAGDYAVKVTATSTGSGEADLYYFTAITISEAVIQSGWARTWGGSKAELGYGVAVDGSGNAYVTGLFQDTVDFDPGSGVDNHTSNGSYDIFLSKFDSTGNFKWANTWGGSGDDWGYAVAVDASGNVHVTGYFSDLVDFDPGNGVDNHTSNGYYDTFLSKFDSSGNFMWARTWGGSDFDEGVGVAVDGSGNAYLTGSFRGTTDFDPGSGVDNHTSIGGWGIFLSKFDSSGNFKWARTWCGSDGNDYGNGIAVDGSGNAYVTGLFQDIVDFDPGSGVDNHISNGGYDIFLSKFDSSGNFKWADTWGGSGDEYGYAVAVDNNADVYVTGYFSDLVDFDPGNGVDNHTSNGNGDIFLSNFNSSGNFKWARTWGGSADDYSNYVAVDGSGNAYVTGYFSDLVDFDPGSGVDSHISNGSDDVFLSKFDSSGNFAWARTWGGSDSDEGRGVAVDGSGNAYVTGYFTDTVDFDPGSGVDNHISNGGLDAFFSKFDSNGNW